MFIAEADPKPPCLRPTSSHAKSGRFMGLGGSGTPDNYEPCPLGTSSRSSATACTNRLPGIFNNFDILDCASCQVRFCDDGVGLTLCRQCAAGILPCGVQEIGEHVTLAFEFTDGNITLLAPNASVARKCCSGPRPTSTQTETSSMSVPNASVAGKCCSSQVSPAS